MNLRCAIVDDEPLAISVLEGLLKKIPSIEVVARFTDAISALGKLNELNVDFLFLDIEMPNLSGIDFLKSLTHPPMVIITSANKSYAVEGFELNVIDYLLKPVSFERVLKAVNKIVEAKSVKTGHPTALPSPVNDYIYLKENKKMVKVSIPNIKYIESIKDYVKVVTKDRTVLTKQNISHFEQILNPKDFIRIHRSYIVALKHVDAYSCTEVEIGLFEIPIGRLYKEETLKRLGDAVDTE